MISYLSKIMMTIKWLVFFVDDICSDGRNTCVANSVCIKGKRSAHECVCSQGYEKNGHTCEGNDVLFN